MTSSERSSPGPLLKEEVSSALLMGSKTLKCSRGFKCLELQGLGVSSRTLEMNFRKSSQSVSGVVPEIFWNFFQKVLTVPGVWWRKRKVCLVHHQQIHCSRVAPVPQWQSQNNYLARQKSLPCSLANKDTPAAATLQTRISGESNSSRGSQAQGHYPRKPSQNPADPRRSPQRPRRTIGETPQSPLRDPRRAL